MKLTIKSVILITLLPLNVYCAYRYEYDNTLYAIYKDDKGHHHSSFQGSGYVSIPQTDCKLGQEVHKEDPNMNEDIFKRTVSCLEMDINESFSCNFNPNWKDEKGIADEYATTCRKEFKNLTLILKIRRYPNGKYWNRKIMKEAIQKANLPK